MPSVSLETSDLIQRIEAIEAKINQDWGLPNCFFNLMAHEFEAVLFSNPDVFTEIANEEATSGIRLIRNGFKTPEHIDDSPETAPSKRIKSLIPTYKKVTDGVFLAKRIGIDRIMQECPHFRAWIGKIRGIARR